MYYRSHAYPISGFYYRADTFIGISITNVTGTYAPGEQLVIDTVGLATITSVTLGGETVPIDSTAANQVTATIPAWVEIAAGETVSLVVDDGTDNANIAGITFQPRAGTSYVNYVEPDPLLNPAETESFRELVLDQYGYTLVTGDQIQYLNVADLTVNADSSFLLDSVAEPSSSFAIYRPATDDYLTGPNSPTDYWLPYSIQQPDDIPDALTFNAVSDAALNSFHISNEETMSGFNEQLSLSISNGEYSKNGGGFSAAVGVVDLGDTLVLRAQASSNYDTQTTVTLTTGSVQHTFVITTLAAPLDLAPEPFSFAPQSGLEPSTLYASNTITVTGINGDSPISINGTGRYRISTDGGNNWSAYTSNAGTVANGNLVQVDNTSSASFSTGVTTTLTIGGVSGSFTLTTRAADTTPNAFSFTDVLQAALNQLYTSNLETISGITDPAPVTVSAGAEVSINGEAWTDTPRDILNDETIRVRIYSSASNSTAVNALVTIGGVSDTYTVTTEALNDENPAQFTFNTVENADAGTVYTSVAVEILDINVAAPISVTGPDAQYSIDGGSFTNVAGTVTNGQQVRVRVRSSLLPNTLVAATLTVGNISSAFEVTTIDVLADGGINESIDVLVFTFPAANDGKRNVFYRNNTNHVVLREILYEYSQESVDINSISFQLQDLDNNPVFGPVNVVLDGHYRVTIPHTLNLSLHEQVIAIIDIDSNDGSQAYLSIVHDVEDRGE